MLTHAEGPSLRTETIVYRLPKIVGKLAENGDLRRLLSWPPLFERERETLSRTPRLETRNGAERALGAIWFWHIRKVTFAVEMILSPRGTARVFASVAQRSTRVPATGAFFAFVYSAKLIRPV